MTDLSKDQIMHMARAAGLDIDAERAETIASRLSGVLAELDAIPDEALAKVEPLPIFTVEEASSNG